MEWDSRRQRYKWEWAGLNNYPSLQHRTDRCPVAENIQETHQVWHSDEDSFSLITLNPSPTSCSEELHRDCQCDFIWILANCAALQPFALVAASRFTMTDIRYFQLEVCFHPHACICTKMFMNFALQYSSSWRGPRRPDLSKLSVSLSNCQETLCCVSSVTKSVSHCLSSSVPKLMVW